MIIKNKDIAEKLGISPSAVSYAINNKKGVSEETRKKVFELLREAGALTEDAAGQAAGVSNGDILLVIHKKHGEVLIDKPFFSSLLESIEIETKKNGYSLIVSHYTPGQNLKEYVESLSHMNVKGVVLQATEMMYEDLAAYEGLPFPMVIVDALFDLTSHTAVSLDDENAFFNGVDYLYRKGHRRIGFLRSAVRIMNFQHHYDGYIRGLSYHGLDIGNPTVITLRQSISDAYADMAAYLKEHERNEEFPTAFMSNNDFIALGAMKALQDAGYRVPEDVSIMGYEDIDACLISSPAMTAIHIDRDYQGRLAVKRLVDIIENGRTCSTQTTVRAKLVERDSVAAIE